MAILTSWQETIKRFRMAALVAGGISVWMINGQGVNNWIAGVTSLQPVNLAQGVGLLAGGTAALDMLSST